MPLLSPIDLKNLFGLLFNAPTEDDLDNTFRNYPDIFCPKNWVPLGGNESNYGIIENQQSNPIASLVEKLTNSIDALLMRKCIEQGIDPKSISAPKTMEEAINKFYPDNKNWDLNKFRRNQASEIQIIADGPPRESSVIIYDNGEGQHPEKFEDTFLSLMRGNKNEIHFVQGKYNMGGSGRLCFVVKKGTS